MCQQINSEETELDQVEFGTVQLSMPEYDRVWQGRQNMREYGRVVYQCTYVRAMVELWVSTTDYSEAAYQDH